MNNDLRQQILVSLRSEGVGEADKAREAIAGIESQMRQAAKSFGEGTATAAEFQKQMTGLGSNLKFFQDILQGTEDAIGKIDVGLHKLQVTAIKFADDYEASLARAAQAAEDLELREAEAFAKAAETHERFLARAAQAEEAAAAKQAAAMAKAQAAADAYAVKVMKAVLDAERATVEASVQINAALAAEDAAEQRHAQVVAEAEGEIERLRQRAAAAMVSQQIDTERVRAANAKAAMLQAREQQHFMDVLREGVEMERTAEKTTVALASAKGKAGEKSNQLGMGVLYASHAFQDLQYGMTAVLNNIPLMVTAFGGSAGLAGGLMAAGVAGAILTNNIDKLGEAFKLSDGPAKQLAVSIDELRAKIAAIEGKPHKIDIDFQALDTAKARLAEMEKRLAAFNQAADAGTDIQSKVAAAVKHIVVEEAGATDQKAGAENLVNILRKIREESGTFWNGDAQSQELKKLIAERNDIKTKVNSGQMRLEEAPGLSSRMTELDTLIPTMQAAIEERQVARIKDVIGSALAGEESGRAYLEDAFRKNRSTFTTADPNRGITPVSPEFGALVAEAKGTAIRGLEEEDAAAAREESSRETNDFIRNNRNKRAQAAEREAKRAAEKAKREANERAQAVGQQANLYGNEFSQQKGPGSLEDAILTRVRRGQSNDEINQGLRGQIQGRLTNVPATLVDEVAGKIIDDAVAKVRAEIAARGNGAVGVNAAIAERGEKLARAQATADRREGREGRREFAGQVGADINTGMTGGAMTPVAAQHAGERAVKLMEQGFDYQAATMMAFTEVMNGIVGAQNRMQQQQANIMRRLNGVQAQQRRNQAQRPPLLPTFPR